jgi:DNA polymerase III sliding clamp (beta) subunit (PCNA family)
MASRRASHDSDISFRVDPHLFADILKRLVRITRAHNTVPAHGAIRLDVTPDTLICSATNGTLSARATLPITLGTAGTWLLPGSVLTDLMAHIDAPTVAWSAGQPGQALVTWGTRNHASLQLVTAAWTDPPVVSDPFVTVPLTPRTLTILHRQLSPAVSRNDTRAILTGIALNARDGLLIAPWRLQ